MSALALEPLAPAEFCPPRGNAAMAARQGWRPAIGSFGFSDVVPPRVILSGVVEGLVDWDVPSAAVARTITIRVLPSTSPCLIVQYRAPIGSKRQFGSVGFPHRRYLHVATRVQTGVVTIRPDAPVGAIIVRLRPEAAACLLGENMQDFADTKIDLDNLFNKSSVSSLADSVAQAQTRAERLAHVESFLLANMRESRSDLLVRRAAAALRRNPSIRIRRLALHLDVSERHLCRNFQCMFGTSPKHFARIARIEKVLAERNGGTTWADAAYACGFTDQAHMINDFTDIVGGPPQLVLGPDRGSLSAADTSSAARDFVIC
jgi:AraC-like DNA-binding protein